MNYLPRVIDDELAQNLEWSGAVLLEGPKACGKTESALQIAQSLIRIDTDPRVADFMKMNPTLVLEGKTPRLLDEWHVQPALWNSIRHEVDERKLPGQFILSGSTAAIDSIDKHSGAGRISRLKMRPMSLFEQGESPGQISLNELFEGNIRFADSEPVNYLKLLELISFGGWPGALNLSGPNKLGYIKSYLNNLAEVDIQEVDGVSRSPLRVRKFFSSLARNTASEAKITTLAADIGEPDRRVSRDTIYDMLEALTRLMVVEDQPAWQTHLRSSATLRKSMKRHFVDPSLAVAALGISPEKLAQDPNFVGFLFESMVIRDLRVYSQPLSGTVFHARDSYGNEVDAIIERADGRWMALEVKLGQAAVEEGAQSLLRFVAQVDNVPPSALIVITGGGSAYQRADGVFVVPITLLGP